MAENAKVISTICKTLENEGTKKAEALLRANYPFKEIKKEKRQYTPYQSTAVFIRDGFIDRYSGKRLIFPPVLRLLSMKMPKAFPYHSNWKMSDCHIAYWELFPTVDHVVPVSRGGKDIEDNWVTTSMLRNSAKANWMIEELGWKLLPPGSFTQWDGMLKWFIQYYKKINLKDVNYLKTWHNAAVKALKNN